MSFATPDELAQFLRITITETDEPAAQLLLDIATGLIAAHLGRDDTWADELDPVPVALKGVCLSAAARAWSNPESLRSLQEQLGSYQEARTYAIAGLALTDAEIAVVSAIFGSGGTAAARAESWLVDVYDADALPDETSIV